MTVSSSKISNEASLDGHVCLLPAIAVQLSASTFTADESSGVVNVTFEREGEISDGVSVIISTASDTAEGTYVSSNRTLWQQM